MILPGYKEQFMVGTRLPYIHSSCLEEIILNFCTTLAPDRSLRISIAITILNILESLVSVQASLAYRIFALAGRALHLARALGISLNLE